MLKRGLPTPKQLLKYSAFSKSQLLLFVVAFGLVGSYFLYRSFAAEPLVASLEAEQMSLPSGGSIITDPAASGGKAMQLLNNGTATGYVLLPSSSDSLTVIARGSQCIGSPAMSVVIDGNAIVSNVAVASTSWNSYTATTNLSAGKHSYSISFNNDYFKAKRRVCDRNLYVDVSSFYGPTSPPTPAPAVALSASPTSVTAGSSATLTWNSTNANSCTASGAWSGTQATSGSVSTGALNITSTYNLTCNGAGGSASGSVTVTLTSATSSGGGLGVLRINPNEAIPSDLSHYSLLILDATRGSQVAALKTQWPQLKIIGYKNLTFATDYSNDSTGNAGVPWPLAQTHPEWFLLNSSGSRVHSVPFPNAWFMDPALASYQDAWYNNVVAFLRAAPWDGVFMDDTNADAGWHLNNNYSLLAKYPTRDAYRAAVRSMLAGVGPRVKAAGFMAIPNIGASWDQPDVWADWAGLTSGAMREHFLKWGESTEPVFTGADWALHTNVERAVEGANRLFVGLTYGASNDSAHQTYIRASFLLFWQPSTNSVVSWHLTDSSAFTLDLGQPLAPAVQNGSLWTRQFQYGSVTVDTSAGNAQINHL